jgi:hypothetical protein
MFICILIFSIVWSEISNFQKKNENENEIRIFPETHIGDVYENVNIIILEEGVYIETKSINLVNNLSINGVNRKNCNITVPNTSAIHLFVMNTSFLVFHLQDLCLLFTQSTNFYFIVIDSIGGHFCSLILTNCFLTSSNLSVYGKLICFLQAGLSNHSNKLILEGCDVTDIKCTDNSVFYLPSYEHSVTIYNSSFFSVHCTHLHGHGACIFTRFLERFNASHTVVRNCSSGDYGSFVYCSSTKQMLLKNVVIIDCKSNNYGGAVEFYYEGTPSDVIVEVEDCVFVGCAINDYCGGINIHNFYNCLMNSCSFENCTQICNSNCSVSDHGGGGLQLRGGTIISLSRLTFKNCLADRGKSFFFFFLKKKGE